MLHLVDMVHLILQTVRLAVWPDFDLSYPPGTEVIEYMTYKKCKMSEIVLFILLEDSVGSFPVSNWPGQFSCCVEPHIQKKGRQNSTSVAVLEMAVQYLSSSLLRYFEIVLKSFVSSYKTRAEYVCGWEGWEWGWGRAGGVDQGVSISGAINRSW